MISINAFNSEDTQNVVVELENREHHLMIDVHYELANNESYTRKYLKIMPEKKITLERVDVEVLETKGAYQPYKIKEITGGHSNWKPGLGQPLHEIESATFWGIEFPAATNYVINKEMNCGYLWGNDVEANQTYISYKSVLGVAGDYKFIDDAFYKYIDNIRIRPLRLQIQYNSWFDFSQGVNKKILEEVYKKSMMNW